MNAHVSIDSASALNYGHRVGSRIGENIGEKLQESIDLASNSISMEDLRECLRDILECAMHTVEYESILPDMNTLQSSDEDIRHGRFRDIQDVIDELQSADN